MNGAGRGACADASQASVRDAPGSRPLLLRGAAFSGWTGAEEGGESRWIRSAVSPSIRCRKKGPGGEKSSQWSAVGRVVLAGRTPRFA